MPEQTELPPLRRALPRTLLRLAVAALVAWAAIRGFDWAMSQAVTIGAEARAGMMLGLVAGFLVLYALLLAVPFVPGIEIGLSLLVIGGAPVAPFVYVATVTGLSLAFLAGRFLPYAWLHRVFADLRMARACAIIEEVQPLSRERRLALLRQRIPGRAGDLAVRWRYLAFALLLNLPGSTLIGGGGGISLALGLTRLFATGPALLTIALAVLPVPLAVWLFGGEMLGLR